MSLLLRPQFVPDKAPMLTILMAIAAAEELPKSRKSHLRQNHKKTEAVCPEIMGVPLRSFFIDYTSLYGASPHHPVCRAAPPKASPAKNRVKKFGGFATRIKSEHPV